MIDIREHGIDFARTQLVLFAELEGDVKGIAESEKVSLAEAVRDDKD